MAYVNHYFRESSLGYSPSARRPAWRDAWGGKLGDDDGTMAHILLAEDDDSMREFLAKALRRAGYQVVPVGDGLDALAQLSEVPFDLLLADAVLPRLAGSN